MSALSRNYWDTVSSPSVVFSAGLNTEGLTAVTFSNSNGVSFGLNAGTITASAAGGGAALQGSGTFTQNTGTIQFANSNGVSFGLTAGQMTATVETDYAGQGFTSATTAGTAVVGTLSTNGLSLGVPSYLTTYSNDLTSGRAGTGFTSATTAGTAIVGTLNTNGLSVGVPAYLTTAALSGDTSKYAGTGFTSTTTTGTAVVGTLNTSGLSLGVPAYITTYVNDLTSGRAGTGFTSTTTAGTAVVGTLNTSGLSLGVPAYITTYVNDLTSGRAGTGFTSTTTAGTAVVGTLNTSGLSLGVPAYITTYVNDLTSGRAGTGFTSATTTGTVIVGTLNTNGLSVGVPAYVTAASGAGIAASNSQTLFATGTVAFSEGGGAITIASSAGGQSLMFSVPQTSSLVGTSGVSISTSGSTISIYHSCINGVGISNTGNTAGNVGYLTNSNYALAGSGSLTLSQSTAAGAATCWIQHPAWITTAAQSSGMASYWANMQEVQGTTSFSLQSNSVNVQPFILPYAVSMSYIRMPVSFANLTSTTVANTAGSSSFYYYQSINAVLYSQGAGANSRSLQQFTSSYAAFTEALLFSISNAGTNESIAYQITYPIEGANTSNSGSTMLTTAAGASIFLHTTGAMTAFTGIHWLDIPMAISLSAGNYWIAFNRSTSSTTSGGGINITGNINRAHTLVAVSQINANYVPLGFASSGAATASTQPVWLIGLGSHSVSAQGATTGSLALSSISSVANFPVIPMQFIRQA